jgi:predicted Rossmann-fold nucleotide-binding protein
MRIMKTKILLLAVCLGAFLVTTGRAAPPVNESCDSSDPLFPPPPPGLNLPFCPYRTNLYTAHELLCECETNFNTSNAQEVYHSTLDWRCYTNVMDTSTRHKRVDLPETTLRYIRLHDLAVEEALDRFLKTNASKGVVGIMGGHDMKRELFSLQTNLSTGERTTNGFSPYMKVALLARKLATNGFTIATGGGPGAMEAGNLGAWMAGYSENELSNAVRELARVPESTNGRTGEWLMPAFQVIHDYPRTDGNSHTESVGVPTWFYGHEPPNPFATHVAKYFENSLREEHLLAIANQGIIFTRGGPGTVQEIFQAACQNSYTNYWTNHFSIVLMDTNFWNPGTNRLLTSKSIPAWAALRAIAGTNYGDKVMVTNDIDAIVEFIKTNSSK